MPTSSNTFNKYIRHLTNKYTFTLAGILLVHCYRITKNRNDFYENQKKKRNITIYRIKFAITLRKSGHDSEVKTFCWLTESIKGMIR